MRVESVDPRDIHWEGYEPVFRVYFSTDTTSWEYELTGADVHEVLEWAEVESRDRAWTAFLVVDRDGGQKDLVALAAVRDGFAF